MNRVRLFLENSILSEPHEKLAKVRDDQAIGRVRLVRFSASVVLIIVGMFLASPGSADAATKTSASSGKWSQAARWVGGVVPVAGDDVFIAPGHTIDYDIPAIQPVLILNTLTVNATGTLNFNDNSDNILGVTSFVLNNSTITCAGPGNRIHTLEVGGNFTNNGTFTTTVGTDHLNVTFNGSGAQTIGGSQSTAFYGLTTANTGAGTTTMTISGSVSAVLTLTTDLKVTSSAVLTQSGTSAGNGDVVGDVRRTDVGATTRAFGNPNVQITNAGTVTTVTVGLVKATPVNFANAVRRTYTLTPVGTSLSAVVRLHYLGAELNSNTEATLELWRQDSGTWNVQSATSRGTAVDTDRWVQKTGVTTFSPWTIAGPTGPTAIEMVGYSARSARDGKVLLQWETGREVNNLGFNVYREEDGKRVRINKSLIVGSGLMASPGTVMTAGRSYAWQTAAGQAKESVFWIEEMDLSGYTVWHGPISSQASDTRMSARERTVADQTVTLSDMATESTYNGFTRPVETFATSVKPGAMKTMGALVSPLGLIDPSNPGVKISLKQEGWYRIGQPQLVAAGLNPTVNPSSLQLFADGIEVPISVITNNGAFDSTGAIEFYGLGLDTPSTDMHVYSLLTGSNGLRITNTQGQGGLPPSNSFLYTVERKDRSIYLTGIHNGDAENFFGTGVGAASVDQAITLKNVDATAVGQATIEIGMQGFTNGPHVVTVSFNGSPLGTIQYSNQEQGVATFQVPNSSLAEGQNLVTLASQPVGLDVSLVDHIRVSYWHTYAADGNALKFSAAENQVVTLAGFTSADVKIFDVTNPLSPSRVAATVTSQKTSPAFQVTVAVPGTGARTLLAIGDDQTRSPLSATRDQSSKWKSKSNAANLVIITHESLKDSYKLLQTLRQSQGLKVALVDVEDLYDEFNFGNKSPQAIKDFLAYARNNWKTAPKYVLLAGSASYDPKNYSGFGQYDLVPTKLIDTFATETASDDWFADFDLDGVAEMAVGRLPTPTSQEAETTVNKLAVYDNSLALNSALLVADGNLDYDFEAANNSLVGLFPGSMTVQKINRGQIGTATAKQQLLDGIATGQKIVNYVGHGSPSSWRDNLLTAADALALTNIGRYPLFIAMTCLNGEFQHPELNPLATALMNSREGGAIAVWASSGHTAPSGQTVMNQQFYSLLFPSNQSPIVKGPQTGLTLGEITSNAKLAVGDNDVRRTWILFGDPSMRVK
jgi:peptidase C25-like protein/G8 domain-containing protein